MAGLRHKYGVLLPECATYGPAGRQDNEPRDRYAIDARHVLPAGPPRSFCEKYLRRLSLFATPAHSLLDISFQWDEGNSEDAIFRGETILSFSVVLNGRFKRDIGITLIFLRFSLFNLRGLTLFKWYGDILGGKRIISKLSKILLFVNDF